MAMIEMLSLRDLDFRSTSGHSASLKANTPTLVNEALLEELMAKGCVPTDKASMPTESLTTDKPAEPSGTGRVEQIRSAMAQLMVENDPDHFGGNGKVKLDVLSGMLEFKVTAQERDAVAKELAATATE